MRYFTGFGEGRLHPPTRWGHPHRKSVVHPSDPTLPRCQSPEYDPDTTRQHLAVPRGGDAHRRVRVVTATARGPFAGHGPYDEAQLTDLSDYWRWFHLVKTAMAVALLVVLAVWAARLWRHYVHAAPNTAAWPVAAAGTVVSALAVVAYVAVVANVQSMVAPTASLMSMLNVGTADGDLAAMAGQVRDGLTHYSGASPAPLRTMVDDLARYHVVVAVIGWSSAVGLTVVAIASVRARARGPRPDLRRRRLHGAVAIASGVLTVAVVVLAAANTSAALDSPRAVLDFYRGTF